MSDVQDKFTTIYKEKTWQNGTSVSGAGSEQDQTKPLIELLKFLIKVEGIKSIVDCPCGDMNWQTPLLGEVSRYVGCDIVPDIVADNIERLIEKPKVKPSGLGFRVLDIITDEVPECDLLIVRDCFVHLTDEMILEALKNITKGGARLVGITSFLGRGECFQCTPELWGKLDTWRPLDMMAPPFNLPCPKHVIVEQCTEGEFTQFTDKTLCIWETEKLKELCQ